MSTPRLLLSITILVCLLCSCAPQGATSPPAAETASGTTPTTPPTSASPEPAPSPLCFTPRQLLPFAFTPNSAGLVLRARQGVQFIDLQTGQEQAFLPSPQMIFTAALSPDGTSLAWSLEDGSVQLVRVADQTVLHTLSAHPDTVYDLRFTPLGDRLLSASHDGWVRVWDTAQGSLLLSIQAGREILGIGITPDGAEVATIPADGPVQLWDLSDAQLIAELGGTGGYDTSDAVFSPDGNYVAADLATGLFLWSLPDSELVWDEVKNSMAVAYSPDERFLAYSDIDAGSMITLAAPNGAEVIRGFAGMEGPVWELFFSPDSSLIAATDGLAVRVWRVADGELLAIGKPACP